MDPIIARKTWRTLEPYHGIVYFAPEPAALYATLGIEGRDGYFASRAAAMGRVEASVVVATFFNFNPGLVAHAIPAVWSKASPADVITARLDGMDAVLRRGLGDAIHGDQMVRAAALARQAAEACVVNGRPLAAAHAELEWPSAPHLVLWHAITVLREHRGDGHIAALVEAGLDGVEALVTHAANGDVPRPILQSTRAWSDEAWDAAVARLASRGLVDDDGRFTEEGAALRQQIEDRTDAMAVGPWAALGEDGCNELRALVRPWSKAVVPLLGG